VRVTLENTAGKHVFELDGPAKGLSIPPGCWRELDQFTDDAIIAVLASDEFDEADYIRDYETFQAEILNAELTHVPYIALDRCHQDLSFELERSVTDLIRSGPFIGGPQVTVFEKAFADYCDVKHVIGC